MEIHNIQNIILTSQHDNKLFGLDAQYIKDEEPKAVVVFIHGFNGFKDWGHFHLWGNYFAERGYVFIRFNLSHNGTTLDNPTEFVDLEAYGNDLFSTDLDDIGVVLDYITSPECLFNKEVDKESIYLVGHSRGGALAMLKAAEDKRVKSIATWSSIISTSHFWTKKNIEAVETEGVVYVPNSRTNQKLPLYRAYYEDVLKNPERLNVEKAIKSLEIPVLIAHGTADESITPDFAHTLKEWKPEAELFMVENAKHTFGGYHPYDKLELTKRSKLLAEKTVAFFDELRK
jgi:uncharacterized protein